MKRLIAVLSGLLVLPAFAEVAPISYDEIVEYSDELIVDDVATDAPKSDAVKRVVVPVASPSRGTSPRSGATNVRNASRVVPAGSATTATRNVATRASASSRNATTARTTTTRASGSVVSRNANASRVSARPSRAAATTAPAVSSRRATISNVSSNASRTARAGSIIQTDTVNTPLYTGRVGVRSNAIQARMPVASGAAALTSTATTSVDTDISDLDELAQITDYCKAQYTSCMDNFCNVLDDAQGRCSCSGNLKNYEKTETALKQANEDLQDIAQQIQYIGLSSDEIETIFSETEAELAMKGKDDNSDNAVDLSRVKDMVIDVRKKTAYSTTSSGTSFDLSGLLSFDFATDFGFDSLFGSTSDTSSISNQRGDQLYKTATARCKATVLNTCQSQGVDISVITNAYDLEIDKQCIAYERSLTDANDQLVKTVRNAQTVLQRARLMVAQKKNEYDGLRECITALDACMQDDYVCGSDYENCLDPTGKYIVNGKVIEGSTPGDEDSTSGLYATWNYTSEGSGDVNTWGTNGSLKDYITNSIKTDQDDLTKPSDNMLVYLQSKIGYYDKDSNKNYGMCIGELNKCQKYSYGPDGEYDIDNQVVREYMQRTLVQIKAAQDELLAKYAENCVRDVSTCLSRNASSASSITRLAVNSCSSIIKTCMSVNGENNFVESAMMQWVVNAVGETTTTSLVQKQLCENSGGKWKDTGLCECTGNKVLQDSVCGYVISGGEYALGQTRFVPNVSNAAVSLPELSSWTYTEGQKADNCYYVYQNGTKVDILNGTTLPVGFSGTDLSVVCATKTLTDEELCTQLGKTFYHNMCVSGADEYYCIENGKGTWTGGACTCNSGYHLDNQKCVANKYTCQAGTYLSGTSCVTCIAGSYCPGVTDQEYNGSDVGIIKCPEHSGSAAGASECRCHSGYHLDNQKCVANTYTLKYDLNGGTGSIPDLVCTTGKTCQITYVIPTKDQHRFIGWKSSSPDNHNIYEAGNFIYSDINNEVLTFVAQWEKIGLTTCDAGYYLDDGACKICNWEYFCVGGTAAQQRCPENSSANNEGSSKCNCWGGYESNGGTTTTSGACTPIKFTVKYNANGGTGTTNSHTCDYAKECKLLANGFTKEGYVFGGWEYQYNETYQPGSDVGHFNITLDNKTLTFKAIWVTDVEKQKCEISGGTFYRDEDGTITCGCGGQKSVQDGVCGFNVAPAATYATDAARVFTAITVGQNVQLPGLSTWTYNSPYSADKCFYVHSDISGSGSTWYLPNGLIPASIVNSITAPSIKCVTNTPILDACNSTVMLEKLGSDCSAYGTSTTAVKCPESSKDTCESYGWSWTRYANVCDCLNTYN